MGRPRREGARAKERLYRCPRPRTNLPITVSDPARGSRGARVGSSAEEGVDDGTNAIEDLVFGAQPIDDRENAARL